MQFGRCSIAATLAAIIAVGPSSHAGEAVDAERTFGDPQVTKFQGGRSAAFSMQFDDSMETHADFAIPEMNKRGLVGTFFVNPATERYARRRETWEKVCPQYGHELANHTLRHEGAADYEEAGREIGGCADHIWKLYPQGSKLRPFLRGGGTTWGISREEIGELMDKYYLFRAPRRTSISDEGGSRRPVVQARRALDESRWGLVGFHGIGGQWISTSEEAFVELLDFLAANRDDLWTGTTGDVYRYTQERDAVKTVTLADASAVRLRISIECDPDKVKTFGRPFTELYDMPLTVEIPVPASWSRFVVTQGDREQKGETIEATGRTKARFDVIPNVSSALVRVVN